MKRIITLSRLSPESVIAAFIVAITAAIGTSSSQDSSPLLRATIKVEPANGQTLPQASEIDQADDELRRMEADLLKTLQEQTPSRIVEEPQGKSAANLKIQAIKAPTPDALQAIIPPVAPTAPQTARADAVEAVAALKELEDHPALEGKKGRTSAVKTARAAATPGASIIDDSSKPQRSTSELEQQLAIADNQVAILTRELDTTHRSLRRAEQQIEELSSLVRNNSQPNTAATVSAEDAPLETYTPQAHTVPIAGDATEETSTMHRRRDPGVATIAVDRAALRVGPGRQESTIITLQRGSTVHIEHRNGEWYRVVDSSGLRGWVNGSGLLFNDAISSNSAIRIGAVRPAYEPTGIRF